MKKLDRLIKKYRERENQHYEYTPIGEVIGDLVSLIPKKKKLEED